MKQLHTTSHHNIDVSKNLCNLQIIYDLCKKSGGKTPKLNMANGHFIKFNTILVLRQTIEHGNPAAIYNIFKTLLLFLLTWRSCAATNNNVKTQLFL